jgi:hypothetical protein
MKKLLSFGTKGSTRLQLAHPAGDPIGQMIKAMQSVAQNGVH